MFDDCTTLEFPRDGATGIGFSFEPELVRCLAAGPGGHPLHVLIDTGTDPSAVDAQLARRLALQTGGRGMGRGVASDSIEFTEAVLPWLRLGDLTIRNLFAPAVDLRRFPFQVDVVLGYNVLQQVSLQIDFRRRCLIFAHPDLCLPQVSARGALLPLDFLEHFPAVRDLEIEGRTIPLATLDTGSNCEVMIGPDLAAAFGLQAAAGDLLATRGVGFGGSGGGWRRRCRELGLGPFRLACVDLDMLDGDAGELSRPGRATIGNRLLARFASMTLDYERRVLALEPD